MVNIFRGPVVRAALLAKTSIFFYLDAFTRERKISLLKIAYFMLNFLNLNSILSNILDFIGRTMKDNFL